MISFGLMKGATDFWRYTCIQTFEGFAQGVDLCLSNLMNGHMRLCAVLPVCLVALKSNVQLQGVTAPPKPLSCSATAVGGVIMGCRRCSLSMHSNEFNVDMFDIMNTMECKLENLNTQKRKPWSGGIGVFFLLKLYAQGELMSKTPFRKKSLVLNIQRENITLLFFCSCKCSLLCSLPISTKTSVWLEGKQWPPPFI